MCGRFTSLTPPEALANLFEAEPTDDVRGEKFNANFNVAPSTMVLAVALSTSGQRKLGRLKWGLVPHWAQTPTGGGQINARSETIAVKPTFRDSFRRHRCIIPMSGYYEWRTVGVEEGSPKRAVYVTRSDGNPLAVAGLWSVWSSKTADGDRREQLRTCCIVTKQSDVYLSPVHDRMPVILDRGDWGQWLGERGAGNLDEVLGLLTSDSSVNTNPTDLTYIDVGPLVNSVRNNGPELIEPVL